MIILNTCESGEVVGTKLTDSLPSDSDGYFLLQAGKTYSFQFGFELPEAG